MINIEEILKPESDLEREILKDPDFVKGLTWGKPRPGHPEGAVIYHIREVLDNIDKYEFRNDYTTEDRSLLRFIAFVHDTFKYQVDSTKAKHGDNHHGYYARKFAEKYIQMEAILTIIQHHDDAYNAWQKGNRDNKWEAAEKRADELIKKLCALNQPFESSIGIFMHTLPVECEWFMKFYRADGLTGDKKNDDYEWFNKYLWANGQRLRNSLQHSSTTTN